MSRPDRYTVLQKIADGGMAELYLGTQHGAEGFQRTIVIKRIRTAFTADPAFRNMLLDEAHIAMGLVHSNIVQVLDFGRAQGNEFLVLELVDGWDLHQLLQRAAASGLAMPPELALHLGTEVCRALSYAHTKRLDGRLLGVVHRDVSPHNILVSEHGEVKLTDFGIATAFDKRERTLAGVVKGKLGFMSPEQASGGPLDHRSDIFSMGTTLYLLVTGRRPYLANTDLEILLRMQQCEFPPPEEAKPDLAPELCAILRKAMHKSPAERYQSAEEMLVDLERVQRSVFKPASQTELKRYLAQLAERDGSLPTSLRPPKDPLPPSPGDLPQGSALILEEVEPDAVLSLPIPLVQVATPSSPPLPPASPPPPLEDSSARRMRRRRRGFGMGIGSIVAISLALMAVVWLVRPAAWAPRGQRPAREVGVVRETAAAGGDAALAAAEAPGSDGGAPVIAQVAEPDAGELSFPPLILTEGPAPDGGEQSGDETPRLDVVSVRVVSLPPGATVLISKQPFGTTPISLRFKPELTYDLSFQKQGYLTLERKVYIPRRKNQTIEATLEKKNSLWPF